MNWKPKVYWLIVAAVALYVTTAAIGSFLADNSKGGCDRANISRGALYKGDESDITLNDALVEVVVTPGVAKALNDDTTRAEQAKDDLTFSPGTPEPWNVDCDAAYPDPLPWP